MTGLLSGVCGGQDGPLDDQIVTLPALMPVCMRLERCHRILGVPVSRNEVEGIFTSLGLSFEVQDDDVFVVTPPSYRFDLFIEEDLIEEVARIYGFERIPDVPPVARAKMLASPEVLRGPHALRARTAGRSEGRRVGKEGVCTCRSRWVPSQ